MSGRKRKVTTVVLTGFLGAGKTTLLNRAIALRAGAVEVEEDGDRRQRLGAIGVDGELLRRARRGSGASGQVRVLRAE
jgi:G3E family GTPase